MLSYIKEKGNATISVMVGEGKQSGSGKIGGGRGGIGREREAEKGILRFRIIEILERIYFMRPTYPSAQHFPQEDSEYPPIKKY